LNQNQIGIVQSAMVGSILSGMLLVENTPVPPLLCGVVVVAAAAAVVVVVVVVAAAAAAANDCTLDSWDLLSRRWPPKAEAKVQC